MKRIDGITANPYQESTIPLDDGTLVVLEFKFIPMQLGWFIDKLTYGDFVLNNLRICNSPNILHQFRNQIPFGIACESIEDREPSLAEDFVEKNSILYLLSEEETLEYSRLISGQI